MHQFKRHLVRKIKEVLLLVGFIESSFFNKTTNAHAELNPLERLSYKVVGTYFDGLYSFVIVPGASYKHNVAPGASFPETF
jgi:hypothetical protein